MFALFLFLLSYILNQLFALVVLVILYACVYVCLRKVMNLSLLCVFK